MGDTRRMMLHSVALLRVLESLADIVFNVHVSSLLSTEQMHDSGVTNGTIS
jgi:hypothetical protein